MTDFRCYVVYFCVFLGCLAAHSSSANSREDTTYESYRSSLSAPASELALEIHSGREDSSPRKIADGSQLSSGRMVKVFDVLESGYKDWSFPAFGLIFVAVGIVVTAFPAIVKALGIPFLEFRSRSRLLFRYAFLAFGLLWTGTTFFTTYSRHLRHQELAAGHGCRIVEGPIEHFVPMPFSGHATESFSVRGVPFRYSDFVVTDGFNNTSSHGGPITSDSYVRICYDPEGNVILRLEIRDFKGPLKDYSHNTSLFPNAEDIKKFSGNNKSLPIDPPWYGNLFVFAFILDIIAIYVLFLPYLRTFFRLQTTPVHNGTILRHLEASTTIPLRNSAIYWDPTAQTIWLRPRGLNLLQIPLTVATLKVDAEGAAVAEYQIRFSSGFPFVLLLFLWAAYDMVSRAVPPNAAAPQLGPLVGFMGLASLLAVFVMWRRSRSRMSILVEEALSELCIPPKSARNKAS